MRTLVTIAISCCLVRSATAQKFTMSCKPPFPSHLELSTDANDQCPAEGSAQADTPHALQNQSKNDLCATGDPATVTFKSFQSLQGRIESKGIANWTATKLPPDRSVFESIYTTSNGDTIGEGSLVKLVAYVMKVKKGGKESVNCGLTKAAFIDYHVVLIPRPDAEECDSVTAEVIPHFRPTEWTAAAISTPDVPMRFTGHLFVDASHKPCKNGKGLPGNPARFTIWEIHPVYNIEVCKFTSMNKCSADDDSVWIPLDQWETNENG